MMEVRQLTIKYTNYIPIHQLQRKQHLENKSSGKCQKKLQFKNWEPNNLIRPSNY